MEHHDRRSARGSEKGFAPRRGEPDEDRETAATATGGSGKQFAPDVQDPHTDERARRTEGSGKEFGKDVDDAEAELEDDATQGSGKQFRPRWDNV